MRFESSSTSMAQFTIYHVNKFGDKEMVFSLQARNLDSAFLNGQNDKNDEYKRLGKRDTTLGDIIVNEDTGKSYVIKLYDYSELLELKEG